MGVFSRSWEITKVTFSVMRKEKELFVFPIISIIFSFLFLLVMLFPTILISFFKGTRPEFTYIVYGILFITYLGLAFIATFFNVCVVYTAALAFDRKPAKFWKTIKFSLSRIHLILMWSLVAATVGLILRIIEGAARKIKGIGGILLLITNSLVGLAWAIATIFVIPGLVYHGLGPFAALKRSIITLKKTWGESLVRYLGMGAVAFLFIMLGLVIGVPLMYISLSLTGSIGLIIIALITVAYLISIFVLFGVAGQIFNTALYVYAETGAIPLGYNREIMKNAFRNKKTSGMHNSLR